jgi:hypothetical protein
MGVRFDRRWTNQNQKTKPNFHNLIRLFSNYLIENSIN